MFKFRNLINTLAPLLMLLTSHVSEARDYSRLVYTCKFKLTREDLVSPETSLATFTTNHFITWSEPGELLRPKFELKPGVGVDPKEWAIFEKRITPDIEKSSFAWNGKQLEFSGLFKLNYDGIYTAIRALGGKDLEDSDDLSLFDEHKSEKNPDGAGLYSFSLGQNQKVSDRHTPPTYGESWRVQAHLPLDKKNGLSFHLSADCNSDFSGVY